MFSSKKFFAVLVALALACSPASAQLATTHAGTVGGPKGTPVSNGCISIPGTTITFTAQGTGNAKANRISVVSINWSSAGLSQLTAVTIGGISMSRASRASSSAIGNNSEIWYVANPTGTSSNIVLTASVALTGATIEVYSLIGYTQLQAQTTGTTSVSQAYTNRQLAIAAGSRAVNVSTSLSNMTNDFSSACGAGLWGVHASQPLKGTGTLTSSISPTSNNPEIALAVWNAIPCTVTGTQFDGTNTGVTVCGLTVSGIGAGVPEGARSLTFHNTAGKFYFEVTFHATDSANASMAGIAQSTATYTDLVGFSNLTRFIGLYENGDIWGGGAFQGSYGVIPPAGTVYSYAIDTTAHLFWVTKACSANWNAASASPASGTGGITIANASFAPVIGMNTGVLESYTANFTGTGLTPYACTPPTGFGNNW